MWNTNTDVTELQDGAVMLDAHAGNWLAQQMKANQYREGYDAFLRKQSRDTLWSKYQKRGYDTARAEAEAAIQEKDAKPGLDATPWQVAEELTPEYAAWLDEFLPDVEETPEMAHWRKLANGAPIALSASYVWADELADLGDVPGHDYSTRPYLY